MDDFGMLTRDLGFRPQGKSAPMKGGVGSDGGDRRARSSSTTPPPFADDQTSDDLLFTDVFGGPPKYASQGTKPSSMSDFDYDSIFKGSATNETKSKSATNSSAPVYDKPVYDEDIFDGLPGLKSKSVSSSARYEENVFASMASPPKQSDHFDDLLGNLGRNKSSKGFDDLLPGFGSGSPNPTNSNRPTSESRQTSKPSGNSNQRASDMMDDPFVVLESTSTAGVSSPGLFNDPLEEISKLGKSGTNANVSSASGGIFSEIDPLDGLGKSKPVFTSEMDNRGADGSSSRAGSSVGSTQNSTSKEPYGKSSFKYSESHSQKKVPIDDVQDSRETLFDMPTASTDSPKPFGETGYSPSFVNANGSTSQADMSPRSEEHVQQSDDIWLNVSEVPLFTQPTSAPPPSRPPPPIPGRASRSENARKKGNEFSSSSNSARYSQSRNPFDQAPKSSTASSLDELEAFAMGSTQNSADENAYGHFGGEMNNNSAAAASAAAMKEAMDRAEAKFRHAKGVREREYAKTGRTKETVQLEKDEEATPETQEAEFRENQDILERRRREEEERELKRAEKERVRAREIERERARQAVERATREARERAAVEARERASAEARLKSERAAVQRAQAEARERAAADARGRAERAAAEARERSNVEAREKEAREKAAVARAEAEARRRAERAAVDRVAAGARERAAVDARDRAAAAARMNQQKNDDDLESFFSSRASSAPRPRASTSDPVLDPQFQSRGEPEVAKRTSSSGVSSNMRKVSSTTNIVDDLSSIFGAASSSGDFQDVEGETEERRRARLERHQRTQERAAKALADKNQRDLQVQRDQEERHRIADTLDVEIRRWAAGKEGNLRALLSTLQYVLWPECGWQPVSLTDLITGASVKKVYRKATLCIHPDKVQQKGANLQQKYVAEKVFDLLKEAWNKFNSEELF